MKVNLSARSKLDNLGEKLASDLSEFSLARALQLLGAGLIILFLASEHRGTIALLSLGVASLTGSYLAKFLGVGRIGFELTTISTILVAALYSPSTAGVFGSIMITVHFLVTGAIGPYMLWVIPSYFGLGFLIDYLGYALELSASISVLAMHILFIVLTTAFIPSNLPRFVPYSLGNAALNLILINVLLVTLVNLV